MCQIILYVLSITISMCNLTLHSSIRTIDYRLDNVFVNLLTQVNGVFYLEKKAVTWRMIDQISSLQSNGSSTSMYNAVE